LDALLEAPGDRELFVMFSDETGGRQTYGAGRFMSFATCPLPPQQNRLAPAIDAGELKYERAH
jgi:uncharacterized protein (DUF1684 family)